MKWILAVFIHLYCIEAFSQIPYDSCWSLLKYGKYEELLESTDGDSFEHHFFSAKKNRIQGDLKEAVKNINMAISFFDAEEVSVKHSDVLDEYSVLLRLGSFDFEESIKKSNESIKMRMSLGDSAATATSLLYKANTFIQWDSIWRDSAIVTYDLASSWYPKSDTLSKLILKFNKAALLESEQDWQEALSIYRYTAAKFKKLGEAEMFLDAKLSEAYVLMDMGKLEEGSHILDEIGTDPVFENRALLCQAILKAQADFAEKRGDYKEAFYWMDSLDRQVHDVFDQQLREAEEKYKSQRLEMEVVEKDLENTLQYRWIVGLSSLFAISVFSTIGFLFYNKQRNKIKEQQLLLEKQQALQAERNRIAAEMHDDLGGGLTTIKFVSQRAMRNLGDTKESALLQKVVNQSNQLVSNMSEIIWAMNSKFDNLESTVAYIRRYAMEFLKEHELKLSFDSSLVIADHILSSTQRRNLLLVIKEALNNIVKHANASQVDIQISSTQSSIALSIADDGVGLSGVNILGIGLENMRERMETIGGEFKIGESEKGTIVELGLDIVANQINSNDIYQKGNPRT